MQTGTKVIFYFTEDEETHAIEGTLCDAVENFLGIWLEFDNLEIRDQHENDLDFRDFVHMSLHCIEIDNAIEDVVGFDFLIDEETDRVVLCVKDSGNTISNFDQFMQRQKLIEKHAEVLKSAEKVEILAL